MAFTEKAQTTKERKKLSLKTQFMSKTIKTYLFRIIK